MAPHCQILISNFENNEVIEYSVILLKGRIVPFKEENAKYVDNFTKLSLNDKEFTSLVHKNGRFNFVIELNLGLNSLVITCNNCGLKSLNLEYRQKKVDYTVVPLYIICKGHDGKFQAPEHEDNSIESARKRIFLGTKLLQCVVAEKMFEISTKRKTFIIDGDNCQIFYSDLNVENIRKIKAEELWQILGREILASSVGNNKKKYLAFLSCSRYCSEKYSEDIKSYDDVIKITEGHVAIGGGGLALFGTACLYTWPKNLETVITKFEDPTLIDKRFFMDDSCYRGTRGACFSTTLGSVLHELCHSFDLGHSEEGIMGRGFDYISNIFLSCSDDMDSNNGSLTAYVKKHNFFENFENFTPCFNKPDDVRRKHFDKNCDIFWTDNCSTLLFYHKWLNDYSNVRNKVILKFDKTTKLIQSNNGIRIIEIRNENDGLTLYYWIFNRKILKFSFKVPDEILLKLLNTHLLLVVEDNFGNIVKENIPT